MQIRKYLDKEDFEWDGIMRLIEGVMTHVLDNISITNKWNKKDISLKTLLKKRNTLREYGKWMNTWQWRVWVNIYSENRNYDNLFIMKRFKSIRKRSVKEVNRRIKLAKLNKQQHE